MWNKKAFLTTNNPFEERHYESSISNTSSLKADEKVKHT